MALAAWFPMALAKRSWLAASLFARARLSALTMSPDLRGCFYLGCEVLVGRLRRVLLLPSVQPQYLRLVAVVPGAEGTVRGAKRVEIVKLVALVAEPRLLTGIPALELHAELRAVLRARARPALVRGGVHGFAIYDLTNAVLAPLARRGLTELCRLALRPTLGFFLRALGGGLVVGAVWFGVRRPRAAFVR